MVSKKKSGKSTHKSTGGVAAGSEDQGNAFQEIDDLLKSLEEGNPAQAANNHRSSDEKLPLKAKHDPAADESAVPAQGSNDNDMEMQWADLLRVGTHLQPSKGQRKSKTKSKKSKRPSVEFDGDTRQAGKDDDSEMQWADLLRAGTGVQKNVQGLEKTKVNKKKSKRDTATRISQTPKQTAPRASEAAGKARHRTNRQNKVSIQEPIATINDLLAAPPGTPSADADDNSFLRKVKSLAIEKKKAQEVRTARANKRTLAAMQTLAGQTEEQNKQIVGQVSKFIITRSSPLEKKVESFQTAVKKQKTENDRCKAQYVQAAKERLTDVDKFKRRIATLTEKFRAQQKAIAAQAESAVQECMEQLRAQVERRNEADLKLKKLTILLRRG